MNRKNKATKHPHSNEASRTSLDGLAIHLSNRLNRVGSVFKQFLTAPAPSEASAPAAPAGTQASTATPAATPPSQRNIPAAAADLHQQVAEDHAWIQQNLARHYRGRPPVSPPEKLPDAEPMDEAAIHARLLKIHGGRLPGRGGRQISELAPDAALPAPGLASEPTTSAAPAPKTPATTAGQPPETPQAARSPGMAHWRPPVTSSKPRASIVKPVPANLRKSAPTVDAAPAAPAPMPPERLAGEGNTTPAPAPAAPVATIELPAPIPVTQSLMPAPAVKGTSHQLRKRQLQAAQRTEPAPTPVPPHWRQRKPQTSRKPISASISANRQPISPVASAVQAPDAASLADNAAAPGATPGDEVPLPGAAQAEQDSAALAPLPPSLPAAAVTPFVKPRIVIRPTISVVLPVTPAEPAAALESVPAPRHEAPMAVESAPAAALTVTSNNWGHYAPPLTLLQAPSGTKAPVDQEALGENGRLIEEKLGEFRVKVAVRDAYAGPVITRYEVEPAVGVRGAQVVNLMKDLARALSVTSIRVVETIPGKTYMGLELPNAQRQMIRLSEVLSSDVFLHHDSKLAMALGKDITGEPVVADLAKAPHMLVAGTTGSGKSVGVNAMILSLLYRATPKEVRFVMIDPKMLELSVYDGIPHLLAPVVTDMKLAANALHWCVTEMERRYRLMSMLGVRNLSGFNQKIREAEEAGRTIYDPEPLVPESPTPLATLPFIVVVVDEFADLMMVAGKKIEELIARLAQKARAAGIHLILATQRPSVDVITGLIKANIPTRIAFQVSSKIDSRTILDQMGAESLLGQGDMLYLPPGTGYPQRVHGAFVADDEVHALAEYLKKYGAPDYIDAVLGAPAGSEAEAGDSAPNEENDPLYDQAVAIVIESRRASISLVQRHLRIGYNRAARLIEQMEVAGIVSPMESNGSRTVLAPSH